MTSELGRSLRLGRGKNSQQKTAMDNGIDIKVLVRLESGVFVQLDEETFSNDGRPFCQETLPATLYDQNRISLTA